MAKYVAVFILFLLLGTITILPSSAQDDLPLPMPKPTLYGAGEIGHMLVPASVEQAAQLTRQADVLRKAGNPDAAQKLYRQAISVAPLVDAYCHYADFIAVHGNPDKAAQIYRYIISPLPKTPEAQGALQPIPLFHLALYLAEAGKTQESLNIYRYAIVNNGGFDGSLPKLDFANKQGFDNVLLEASCHLGLGFELASCSDPDYPTSIPTRRTEFLEATRTKPDWAVAWRSLTTEMDIEVSEHYGTTVQQALDNKQLGREAATRYLELAQMPNSGETPLEIQIVSSWLNRDFK